MCTANELDQVTFFGRSDHVDRLGRKDKEGGREFVTEKPELRAKYVSISGMGKAKLESKARLRQRMTYVHGVVLLEGALIGLSLAHEDNHGVRAAEQRISRALVCLP